MEKTQQIVEIPKIVLGQQMERCILCNKQTEEPVNKPILYRNHYIEGAGQACKECYYNICSVD